MINYLFNSLYWIASFIFSTWIAILGFSNYAFDYTCLQFRSLASEYDYIVVGAGSAGTIVASRLAEDPNASILLIEAGQSCSSWMLDIPILSPLLQLSPLDWQYQTVTQHYACYSLDGNSSRWPRGKLVGGSSRLNYLMYVRGHKQDYNLWSEKGNPGWGYFEDTLQYFKRSEKQNGRYRHDSYHSTLGPTVVSDVNHATPLAEAFVNAGQQLGYPARDLNSEHQTGFMHTQVHVNRGQRWNIDYGYLNKHNTDNIHILCSAHVDKVLFDNEFEAKGIEGMRFGEKFRVDAKRAVVLSSGTIGTPVILMRSGIGPSSHLTDLQIPVLRDLPVGENLQDHVTTGFDLVLLNQSLSVDFSSIASIHSFMQYMLHGKGPWTLTGCEAYSIIHTDLVDSRSQPPDLQIMALPMGLSSDYGNHMRKAVGIKEEVWDNYFAPLRGKYVASIMPVLLHPKSRGVIKLKSHAGHDPPTIDPNYLSHQNDIKTLYEGIKLVKNLLKTQAMQNLGAHLYEKHIPGCENEKFDTVNYWYCYIKHMTVTSYHPVGTCKMGQLSDRSSVVDADLRVHGINKLFVIDASVMPSLPSGNINAAVMMIAEKGADSVKQFWYKTMKKSTLQEIFHQSVCDKL